VARNTTSCFSWRHIDSALSLLSWLTNKHCVMQSLSSLLRVRHILISQLEAVINYAWLQSRLLKGSPISVMRAVIQRVSSASVTIAGQVRASIGHGLLLLAAVEEGDSPEDIAWLSGKIVRLRLFNDDQGVMNRSVQETGGEILAISQFTLFASTKKGNRPSYIRAAKPDVAVPLYEMFLNKLAADFGKAIATGEFGADMKVALVNDGPVTIVIDTKARE